MSELRQRLADALREHLYEWDEDHWHCAKCEIPVTGTEDWAVHVADVLLSLPGIAIVELPEPMNLSRSDSTFPHDIVAYPGGVMDCDCDLKPSDARSIAAVLLAAANKAEEQ